MQQGGCEAHTRRQPCRLDNPFEGAKFTYLAANVLAEEVGETLFAGTAIRQFGNAKIGFIGMTLEDTGSLVSPAGTAGYRFADEAETANRLAAELEAQGADAVVLVIHQGADVDPWFSTDACPGLDGAILPILARLTPDIRLVVSGHTHKAYVCEVPDAAGNDRLLTSAGRYGNFATDIRMTVDPASDRVLSLSAVNRPVTAAAGEDADVAQLVSRYAAASRPAASRVVGRVTGSLDAQGENDSPLARLVADAQLAATRAYGAQVAFINSGGVRAGFTRADDGSVTFGQIFALQPFGNTLVVVELTGEQLRQVLESQYGGDGAPKPSILVPSAAFAYSFDRSKPAGQRVVAMTLDGRPVDPAATYRVTVNNFLASGGDGFAGLAAAKFIADGGQDLDALESFIAGGVVLSPVSRVVEVTRPARP
jgi:5'-nucleotidase